MQIRLGEKSYFASKTVPKKIGFLTSLLFMAIKSNIKQYSCQDRRNDRYYAILIFSKYVFIMVHLNLSRSKESVASFIVEQTNYFPNV